MLGTTRRDHFAHLRRISTGEDATISYATALESARAYHRAWLATDRLLPVPKTEAEPDGDLVISWIRDQLEVEIFFCPGESPFWTSVEGNPWSGGLGDWQVDSPVPEELAEYLGLIVGREPERPIPPPMDPPSRRGLLQRILDGVSVVIIGSLGIGIAVGHLVLGTFWYLVFVGCIMVIPVAFLGGLILWDKVSAILSRGAGRPARTGS